MDRHNESIARVAASVKSFYDRGRPFRVYHGSTNSTRQQRHDPNDVVDISSLRNILKVDMSRRVVVCEPNVPMDDLVIATLKEGLVPPVVPEFPGITVGGSFSGTAGESSSFKHGFFDRTVNWCQMILANGTVITASPTENADLFYGAAGAMGTLGLTTLFEIQLEEAEKYVELEYLPVVSAVEAIHALQRYSEEENACDYIDAIMLSANFGVIVVGRRISRQTAKKLNPPPKRKRFRFAWNNWFYLHAWEAAAATRFHRKNSLDASDEASFRDPALAPATSSFAASRTLANSVRELVPLKDYLFRYDRGAFWMGTYAFTFFLTPFNRITRFLLDPLLHTRKMYSALHHSGHTRRFIIQDLVLPALGAVEFCDWLDSKFAIYPLWLCPIRAESPALMHSLPPTLNPEDADNYEYAEEPSAQAAAGTEEPTVHINVGVWGPPKKAASHGHSHSSAKHASSLTSTTRMSNAEATRRSNVAYGTSSREFDRFVADNRLLERQVRELGGMKWLYAQSFYTPDEFWTIYDREQYDELREKYEAQTLPNVFEKVKLPDGGLEGGGWRRPSRLRGILYAVMGREHLLTKKK